MSEQLQEVLQQKQNEGNRIAWFVTGLVIGATVTILYAPKSGKAARQFLLDKTEEGRHAMTDTGLDILQAGRDMFERGRQLVADAAELFERGRRLVDGN